MKRDGTHSCQLIFFRSKLIPDGLSQPRAKLFAATMNAHTDKIVRRPLQENHRGKMKLTDNQVVLFWLSNRETAVKQWMSNRVIEILRFTDSSEWFFISIHNLIANLGVRPVEDLRLVDQNSTWVNGSDWMRKDNKKFPIKLLDQKRLSREELAVIQIKSVLKHNLDLQIFKTVIKTTSTWQMNNNFILMFTNRKSFHTKSHNVTNALVIFSTQSNIDSEPW